MAETAPISEDGNATATATEAPPPYKEKQPNEPAPEGEGIMGAPLKRMMYVGAALLLYYILSFWMPVYWMSSAADYCPFICNNYPNSGGISLSALGGSLSGSSSISFSSSYTSYSSSSNSYGSSSISFDYGSSGISFGGSGSSSTSGGFSNFLSGQAVSGCYKTTDISCDAACETYCDLCDGVDGCSDSFDTIYQASYIANGISERLAAFSLIVIGMCLGAVGCILGYFAVKQGNRLFSQIATVLLALAGAMIFIGAIVFMATWNENIDLEELLAAWQILVFIEYAIPSSIAIIMAIDIFNPLIFNDENKRILAYSLPFAIGGLLGGCLYAYIINYDYGIGNDYPLYDNGGCIAAGYFILGLMSIARILIWGEHIKFDPATVITAKFAVAVLMIIGFIVCCIGYWSLIDALFDCEVNIYTATTICESITQLIYINGDTVSTTNALFGNYDIPYESQFKCYYVSYTLFILLMCLINAYDMDIIGNYKKVRAAQQAAAAASDAK